MAGFDPKAWINLQNASVVLLDGSELGMQILKQIFAGLGARKLRCFSSGREALDFARSMEINLIVASDSLADMSGFEFVKTLRRAGLQPNSFTPAIMVTGHTRRAEVANARDCGANFVVAKPMSPQVLLERVLWVAQESRPFVEAGDYLGPDRRFKENEEEAKPARRRGDAVEDPGAAEALAPPAREVA